MLESDDRWLASETALIQQLGGQLAGGDVQAMLSYGDRVEPLRFSSVEDLWSAPLTCDGDTLDGLRDALLALLYSYEDLVWTDRLRAMHAIASCWILRDMHRRELCPEELRHVCGVLILSVAELRGSAVLNAARFIAWVADGAGNAPLFALVRSTLLACASATIMAADSGQSQHVIREAVEPVVDSKPLWQALAQVFGENEPLLRLARDVQRYLRDSA